MSAREYVCVSCGWSKPIGRGRPPVKCPKCKGVIARIGAKAEAKDEQAVV